MYLLYSCASQIQMLHFTRAAAAFTKATATTEVYTPLGPEVYSQLAYIVVAEDSSTALYTTDYHSAACTINCSTVVQLYVQY